MNIYSGVRSFPSRVGVVQFSGWMLKMSADCFLSALPGTVKREMRVSRELRPWLGQGASQGKESVVLADSGREGEKSAFLNILLEIGKFGERLGDSFQW